MTARLVKLRSIKARLGSSSTDQDAMLLGLMLAASDMAERLAGLNLEALRYDQAITQYPSDVVSTPSLWLSHRPVWSVASIKMLELPGDAAAFLGADAVTLVAGTDYQIDSEAQGLIKRIDGYCWPTTRNRTQVIYAGGYLDPARVDLGLTTATYNVASRSLTQSGAFENYTFTPGDVVYISGGTDVRTGAYLIASKTDDDSIVLADDGQQPSYTDLTDGDITDAFTGPTRYMPDHELQAALEQQVIKMFQARSTGGVSNISAGGGGSVTLQDSTFHPALIEWSKRFKRRFFI